MKVVLLLQVLELLLKVYVLEKLQVKIWVLEVVWVFGYLQQVLELQVKVWVLDVLSLVVAGT
jgi:hypothetical protein